MTARIRGATLRDVKRFRSCIGAVAAERKWLGLVSAPPLSGARKWMKAVLHARFPFLLVEEGKRVVGWCDVAPRELPGFGHTGGLGMGLLEEARGQGIGTRLLREAIARSRRRGIEKLELQVHGSNRRAIRLYRKFRFAIEGRRRKGRKLDGRYEDIVLMALFLRKPRRRRR